MGFTMTFTMRLTYLKCWEFFVLVCTSMRV